MHPLENLDSVRTNLARGSSYLSQDLLGRISFSSKELDDTKEREREANKIGQKTRNKSCELIPKKSNNIQFDVGTEKEQNTRSFYFTPTTNS